MLKLISIAPCEYSANDCANFRKLIPGIISCVQMQNKPAVNSTAAPTFRPLHAQSNRSKSLCAALRAHRSNLPVNPPLRTVTFADRPTRYYSDNSSKRKTATIRFWSKFSSFQTKFSWHPDVVNELRDSFSNDASSSCPGGHNRCNFRLWDLGPGFIIR